ncbi:SusC/RagA family TonB-linked outer membrane protein [Pedobacter ginsengisoli]|nr:SusC/RagA family TonB-linked outer membrane protein [Pedobacter ginsengisoli]
MRITTIILFAAIMQVSASSFAQRVTLIQKNITLDEFFREIRKQTGYNVSYSDKVIDDAKRLNVNFQSTPLEQALTIALQDQKLSFEISDKDITILKKTPSFLERLADRWAAIDVHGRVVDQEGKPLPGATVKVKGTGKSVSANAKGEFFLEKLDETELLVISFIGYVNKEVTVEKQLGNIVLEISDSKLDEIQITAYGKTTQRLSTGNISTVKAEDIAKAPVANPLLAIAGRIPGVFIQQSSGVPGAGVKIVIQGQNSMEYGNDPFYVVDGVPYTSQLLPGLGQGILGDSGPGAGGSQSGTAGNPLNFINPQDIESIDILKDADATSIYGSRAAHGAIIITTKKGVAGKTAVNFNVQQGWGQISRKMKMLNTQQYLEMRKEAFANDNRALPIDPSTGADLDLSYWDQNRYTDWQKELLGGTAKYTNALATINGGNSNTQFRFSIGYQRDGTVTPGDLRDQKGSISFNLNSTSENKRFKFSLSASYVTDDNKLAGIGGIAVAAYTYAPNAPKLYNENGTLFWDYISPTQLSLNNPLAILNNGYVNKTQNLISNAIASYEIIPGLELKNSFGYNKLQSDEVSTMPSSFYPPHYRPFAVRSANFNTAKMFSWIIEPQLRYIKSIWKGKLDVLLGASIQQEDRDRLKLEATGFSSDESMYNLKAAANVRVSSENNGVILTTYKYAAIFGLINYNINDKYLLNYSIRRDGSSRFGKENKFHNFSSIAGAWIFSNEASLSNNLSFLSFGKIKASYGTTGSDQIGDYSYLNLYQNVSTEGGYYQGAIGLAPFDSFPNPYLQWEETKKLSATLNLGFLNDRILMDATWYRNRCSNQLGFQNFATSVTGGAGIKANRPATVQNMGWELGLNTINVTTKYFKWSTSVNLTIPRNKLIRISNIDADNQRDLVGKPLGVQKVYHFLGVDPQTGLYQVQDRNGNATSTPDASLDQMVYIDLNPSYYGGFQSSFSYKGLSLDLLFQFTKQKGLNNFFGQFPGGLPYVNQPTSVLDRWQKIGDLATIQAYHVDFTKINQYVMAKQSDKSYSDASYVRLKNVSLSCQLPSIWKKTAHIQNARVFMQGQNLLTFTRYVGADPETRNLSGIPALKVLTLGVQIGL